MLKGEVFGRQLFENQIFALFINTFLNGNNGVCGDYYNGMAVTYSGNNVTIDSGAVCIQGRFLEEDTSTTLDAGNSNLFCKLVIEIDLDKINTEDSFNQGYYKVVTDSTGYPELTQTNIVGTNSGIYQYELARFKTSANGISDFQDMRTYLDIPTIYDNVRQMVQDAIDSIEDGSAFALKTDLIGTVLYENPSGIQEGNITLNESIENYNRLVFYTPDGQWLGEQIVSGASRIILQQLDQGVINTLIRIARLTVVNNTTLSFYSNKNIYYDGSRWARSDSIVTLGKIIGFKY